MPNRYAFMPLTIFANTALFTDEPQPMVAAPLSGFCNCPDKYSYELYNDQYTIYFGACNHRHGYNILGRIPEREVDKKRLEAMIYHANLGLKASSAPNH